ncbi:MAG: hypothetical protein IJM59_10840 [Proteobacteria bacterium]|nr:hypothetical protein [Pseudomonadota bacterium]
MMKAKPYLLAALACIFMGCEMAEVVDWGSDCPTDDSKSLTYIGKSTCTKDNASACQLDGKTYDFSTNFDIRRCPKEFSVCAVNEDDSNYHCEKDTKKGCADTQITCPRNDGTDDVDCIDPSSTKTCGATDCKSINYGGKDCSEYGELSRCQFSNDTEKYVCRCPNGALLCGTQCIDPNDPKYCGASDCDAENYGGIDCEKGDAYCANGKCTCSAGSIWCSVNGEPEKCVSPRENATCNAHLSEDGSTCEITPCDDNQSCTRNGDVYSCSQYKCDDDQQLCDKEEEKQCIPKLDDDNCGNCNNKCSELLLSNAHGSTCTHTDEGKYVCTYECNEGFENCGSAIEPNCVALNTFQHCGACNHTCENNEACDPETKTCIPTGCAPNECPLPGKDGGESECVMDDEHCGSNCQICSNVHENASCLNGTCVVSECNEGEHPVFEETLIIRCDPNTITSCAPKDIKVSEAPVDCTETLANAHEVKCTEEGKCAAVSCEPGFHLNKDNSACLANTSTLCGSGDSSEVVNCDEEIADAVETECVSNVCFAKKCAEGFHLSSDLKMCEANDTSKCAPVDSSDAKDCSIVANAAQTECVNGFCKAKQCMPGNHLSQDKSECVANSDSLCGAIDSNTTVDCTTLANADNAVCESGSCIVNKCKENYHISKDNKSCVTNTNTSCASASSTNEENCQDITNASSTECDKGSCIVLECKSGFHVSPDNKSCISNESTKCAPPNGGQEVNCNDAIIDSAVTTCNAGVCEVVECAVDHHPSSDKKSCIKNTATACASTTSSATVNCNNKILNSATTTCNKGVCKVTNCAANHHITNSDAISCTANSNTQCGATSSSTTVNCNTTIIHSTTTACTSGACTVSNCESGFHLNSSKTACVETTAAACAATNSSSTIDCNTTIQNSATTSCSNGTCYVSKCASGFHLNSGKTACDANSQTSCAPTNSNSPTNCTSIANAVTTACSTSGTCTVSKCKDNYHLNSGKTGCDANSQTSCAPTTSNSPTNCTAITNAITTACSSSGTCTVSKCKDNYHLNSGKTGCDANTQTSCAPTTSNSPVNCTSIANSVTTACNSSGSCVVSKCANNYHLNSGKTGCDANSNTSCAATTSNSPVNCTSGIAKYCVSGSCQCSTDGSTVFNWNNSACVPKSCKGVPGVMAGSTLSTSWYDYHNTEFACNPSSCATDFKRVQQGGNVNAYACLPKESTYNCISTMGYKYKNSEGYCIGRKDGSGVNGHAHCKDNYRQYITACLHKDVCCGTRNTSMGNSTDYLCTNCLANGKSCNMTSGTCQ